MEPRTITTVNRLEIGDRFYKVSDRKKVVYERVKGYIKRTKYKTYGFWGKADDETKLQAFDGKTRVKFLRKSPDNRKAPVIHFTH